MATEIEFKFLVRPDADFKSMATGHVNIAQGYLSENPDCTVRVRIAGDTGYITVKTRNMGATRNEWEYPVPVADAEAMLAIPGVKALSKTRYYVPYNGHTWEVDCFHGALQGLVVAEIELTSPDEPFALPPFVGRDVTDDPRYYNSVLVTLPSPPDTGEG